MKLFHQPLSRRRALAVLGAAPLGFGIGVHAETLPEVTSSEILIVAVAEVGPRICDTPAFR